MKGQIKIGKNRIHSIWRLFRCFQDDDNIIKAMFCDTKSDDEVWFDLDEEAQKDLYSTLKDKFEVNPALLKNKELRKLLAKPNFKPNMPPTGFSREAEFNESDGTGNLSTCPPKKSTAQFVGHECKLAIDDHGDPSVGIFARTFLIECPFETHD